MLKFIHCADFHLDSPFAGLSPGKVAVRRRELKESFSRVIALCEERRADALFIAGDLFDNAAADLDTIQFLDAEFAKIPNVQVFIAAGNHDPYGPDSFYTLYPFSENVHIFGTQIEHVRLKDTDIYGVSLSDRYVADGLLSDFSCGGGIMVMHGQIGTTDEYNPITPKQIEQSGLTYLALGHVHAYSGILSAGQTKYAYSGAPEGRGFDETGDKGVIFGTVEGKELTTEFMPICSRRYHYLAVDVTGAAALEEITGRILNTPGVCAQDLLKVTLTGTPVCQLGQKAMETLLCSSVFDAKVIDNTAMHEEEAIGLKAQFIKALGDDELSVMAQRYGLLALSKKEIPLYED